MGGRAFRESPQAGALGVEQPGRAHDRRAVFEQREQVDGAREGLEQGARDGPRRFVAAARRGRRPARQIADGGEGARQFVAGPLAVREEARDVAAVDAAAGDEQVVARAAGEPAQFHLPRGGAVVRPRVGAGQREARVTLDAFARGVEDVARRLVAEEAGAPHRLFGVAQRVDRLALRQLDLPSGVHGMLTAVRAARRAAPEQKPQSRQRPDERHARGPRERKCAAPPAFLSAYEEGDAEGRCRREVDDGEFAQTHDKRQEGNAHASSLR